MSGDGNVAGRVQVDRIIWVKNTTGPQRVNLCGACVRSDLSQVVSALSRWANWLNRPAASETGRRPDQTGHGVVYEADITPYSAGLKRFR